MPCVSVAVRDKCIGKTLACDAMVLLFFPAISIVILTSNIASAEEFLVEKNKNDLSSMAGYEGCFDPSDRNKTVDPLQGMNYAMCMHVCAETSKFAMSRRNELCYCEDSFFHMQRIKNEYCKPCPRQSNCESWNEGIAVFRIHPSDRLLSDDFDEDEGRTPERDESYRNSQTDNYPDSHTGLCSVVPCQNGGTCQDIEGREGLFFNCLCAAGFRGRHCQHEISECQPGICGPGTECETTENGPVCKYEKVTEVESTDFEAQLLVDEEERLIFYYEMAMGLVLLIVCATAVICVVHCCRVSTQRKRDIDIYTKLVELGVDGQSLAVAYPHDVMTVSTEICCAPCVRKAQNVYDDPEIQLLLKQLCECKKLIEDDKAILVRRLDARVMSITRERCEKLEKEKTTKTEPTIPLSPDFVIQPGTGNSDCDSNPDTQRLLDKI